MISDKLHILKNGQAGGFQIAENPLLITKLIRMKIAQLIRQKNMPQPFIMKGINKSRQIIVMYSVWSVSMLRVRIFFLVATDLWRMTLFRVKVLGVNTQELFAIPDFSLTPVIQHTQV